MQIYLKTKTTADTNGIQSDCYYPLYSTIVNSFFASGTGHAVKNDMGDITFYDSGFFE